MNHNEYEKRIPEFTTTKLLFDRVYLELGLYSELGEVLSFFKKKIRGDRQSTEKLILEMGDCYWYAVALLRHVGSKFDDHIVWEISPFRNYEHAARVFLDLVSTRDRHNGYDTAFLDDVLVNLQNLGAMIGVPLETVLQKNIEKLEGRRERGTLQGDGDDR